MCKNQSDTTNFVSFFCTSTELVWPIHCVFRNQKKMYMGIVHSCFFTLSWIIVFLSCINRWLPLPHFLFFPHYSRGLAESFSRKPLASTLWHDLWYPTFCKDSLSNLTCVCVVRFRPLICYTNGMWKSQKWLKSKILVYKPVYVEIWYMSNIWTKKAILIGMPTFFVVVFLVHHSTKYWIWYIEIFNKTGWSTSL